MPEQSSLASEAKEVTMASTEKAVAKVKIDLKATKVNKKSGDLGTINNNNNNNISGMISNQNHQITSSSSNPVLVPKSDQNSANETSRRDLSQVSPYFHKKFTKVGC